MENLVTGTDFWAGRKVFVTGHTGFKGSWLVLMLNAFGAEVTGYSLPPPTEPSMFELLRLDRFCQHVLGDVRDQEAMERALRASGAEVVLHLAAQPLVRHSYAIPIETYEVNVIGTAKLLEACRNVSGVRSIVVVTTDKCYENHGVGRGFREDDRLGGTDPYSNSKACCELVVDAYRQSYFSQQEYPTHGVGLGSVRAGNVIGGGDFSQDRIVPDAVSAFIRGEVLAVRYPDAVRPWQHVLEPLSGYLLLAERLLRDPTFGEPWNFGPSDGGDAPVADLVDRLVARWGGGAAWEHIGGKHLHEAALLKLNIEKAAERLNWRPRIDFHQAIDLTVEWYLSYSRQEDLEDLTRRQIQDFLSASKR